MARIHAFLDARYTSADVWYSFHTKFGETVDCIDFFAQPGVKEMRAEGRGPTQLPVVDPPPNPPHLSQALLDVAFDGRPDDQGNPRACPHRSVPMLRITPDQILKVGGLASYISALSSKEGNPTSVPPGVPVPWKPGTTAT